MKDGEGDVTVLTGADVKAGSEAARESVVAYANNTSGYATSSWLPLLLKVTYPVPRTATSMATW